MVLDRVLEAGITTEAIIRPMDKATREEEGGELYLASISNVAIVILNIITILYSIQYIYIELCR